MGLNKKAKVRFRGDQYETAKVRFEAGLCCAQIGIPGSGKTLANKMILVGDAYGIDPSTLTFDELDEKFRQGLIDEKFFAHTGRQTDEPDDLIGCYVKQTEIRCSCGWQSLVIEGESDVNACPDCSSATIVKSDSGLVWRWGPLSLAMGADSDVGRPFFYNEMSRSPQKSQDVMIPVISESYLSVTALGRIITAKPGFKVIADMNTEEHDSAVESFCWALGRRLRKVYFYEPTEEVVQGVLEDQIAKKHEGLIGPIMETFKEVMSMYHAGELPRPPLVSGMLEWANDFAIEIAVNGDERAALVRSAELTWLPDVVGHNRAATDRVKAVIESAAQTFKMGRGGKVVNLIEEEAKFAYEVINRVFQVEYLPYEPMREMMNDNGVTDYSLLWTLTDPSAKLERQGLGTKSVLKVAAVLNATKSTAGVEQDREGYPISKEKPEHWKTPYRLGTLLREFVTEADLGELHWGDLNDLLNRGIHTFSDLAAMSTSDVEGWVSQSEWRKPLLTWLEQEIDRLQNLSASGVLL